MSIFISSELPRCSKHGQMNYDFDSGQWVCHGFDGEGCDYVAPAEWVYLGETAEGMTSSDTL